MNYFNIPACCFVFLFITACDTQAQITSVNNIQKQTASNEKEAVSRDIAIEKTATDSALSYRPRQPLNLSIENVLSASQTDDDMFFKDDNAVENNSALFDDLSRKYPDRRLRLSGELLTDENEYESKDILKSVNGVQINIQGKFN